MRVAIVTGAGGSIGRAAALELARQGWRVVAADVDQAAAADTATQTEGLAVKVDIGSLDSVRAMAWKVTEEFGRIDALVNNGGIIEPIAPMADADPQAWQQNWAVNLLGPVMLTRLALPHLRPRGGRIINISSGAAIHVIGGWGAYSAAKSALNHLTRVLASEEPAVTAISIRPGVVDTAMQVEIRAKGKGRMAEANYNRLNGLYERGELLPPEAPGRAIACLALAAPHEWSGELVQWDDARVQELVSSCSGSR